MRESIDEFYPIIIVISLKKNERFIYCMLNKPIDIEEDARKRRKKNETTVMVQLYVTLNINHCNVCLQGNQTNNCDQLHEGY